MHNDRNGIETHHHQFARVFDNAFGYFAKRDCPGSEWPCAGAVDICKCGTVLFIPHDRRLHPQEASREWWTAEKKQEVLKGAHI